VRNAARFDLSAADYFTFKHGTKYIHIRDSHAGEQMINLLASPDREFIGLLLIKLVVCVGLKKCESGAETLIPDLSRACVCLTICKTLLGFKLRQLLGRQHTFVVFYLKP
jgi:hypothetical protein